MMKKISGLKLNIVVYYVTLKVTPAEMMTPQPWNVSCRALDCCSNDLVKATDWNSTILSKGINSSQSTQWHLSILQWGVTSLQYSPYLLERRNWAQENEESLETENKTKNKHSPSQQAHLIGVGDKILLEKTSFLASHLLSWMVKKPFKIGCGATSGHRNSPVSSSSTAAREHYINQFISGHKQKTGRGRNTPAGIIFPQHSQKQANI